MRDARRVRCVGFQPNVLYFEPRAMTGAGARGMGFYNPQTEKILKVEELESIRLKDYLRLDQAESAKLMDISQPTFHRIITEAHRKIAEAFVEGKAIRIEGGSYVFAECKMPARCGGRKHRGGRGHLASFNFEENV